MKFVNQPIVKHNLGLLNLAAAELDNVSQACRIMGVSRDTFYRYREARPGKLAAWRSKNGVREHQSSLRNATQRGETQA